MEAAQLLLPAMATAALGTALLVPLRDDRRGRRATHAEGTSPLRPDFRALTPAQPKELADTPAAHPAPWAHSESANGPHDSAKRATMTYVAAGSTTGAPAASTFADAARADAEPVDRSYAASEPATSAQGDGESTVLPILPRQDRASWTNRAFDVDRRVRRTLTVWNGKLWDAARCLLRPPRDVDCVTTVIERPFADELAALLATPQCRENVDPSYVPPSVHAGTAASTALIEAEPAAATELEAAPEIEAERAANIVSKPTPDDFLVSELPSDTVVIATTAARTERVIPLTRLPLRAVARDITWALDFGKTRREERHALLASMRHEEQEANCDTLVAAYHQEDVDGRSLALRALAGRFPRQASATFINALASGSDAERAIAVDGLVSAGEQEALAAALGDRVDAIAARAALAYVGSTARADYVAALRGRVDEARLAAILALLGGLVE